MHKTRTVQLSRDLSGARAPTTKQPARAGENNSEWASQSPARARHQQHSAPFAGTWPRRVRYSERRAPYLAEKPRLLRAKVPAEAVPSVKTDSGRTLARPSLPAERGGGRLEMSQ